MATTQISETRKSTGTTGGFSFGMSAFALVPEQLVDDENRDLWVNFLRDRIPHNQSIESEEFPDQHLLCLTENGKDLPHAIPYLLHEAERHLSDGESDFVLGIRQDDHLALLCYQHGALQLGNIYEAGTKEQTLYWILKLYEVQRMSMRAPLYIRCGDGTHRLLNTHLNTIKICES